MCVCVQVFVCLFGYRITSCHGGETHDFLFHYSLTFLKMVDRQWPFPLPTPLQNKARMPAKANVAQMGHITCNSKMTTSMPGILQACLEFFKHAWNSWSMPGILQACLEFFKHAWNSSSMPGILQACLEFFKHAWNSSSMPGILQACLEFFTTRVNQNTSKP